MTEAVTRKMVKAIRPNAKARLSKCRKWWSIMDGAEEIAKTMCGRKAAWEFAIRKLRAPK